MKLKYLFTSAIVFMALLSGCVKEDFASLDGISAEPSYVSLGFDGGSKTSVIKANADWKLEIPSDAEWLTVSPTSGPAAPEGVTVTFTMEATETPRKVEVLLVSGEKTQIITVGQNGYVDPVITSCKDFADDSKCPTGGMYYVEGFITKVEKYDYGNLYIKDDAGDEVYVYGVLDADGQKQNFTSLGIDVGDKVILYGLKKYYNTTLEMENATLIEVTVPAVFDLNFRGIRDIYNAKYPENAEKYSTYTKDEWKNLLKADLQDLQNEGGDIQIPYTFKGDGFEIVPGVDWITLKGISQSEAGYVATLAVAPYKEDKAPRETTLILKGNVKLNGEVKESNLELPVKQFGNTPDPSPIASVVESGAWSTVLGKVILVNGRGVLVTDGVDVLYGYIGSKPSCKVGDILMLTGKVTAYNGGLSMNKPVIKTGQGSIADYVLPEPVEVTSANVADYVTPATPYLSPYVSVTGTATVEQKESNGMKYYNVKVKVDDDNTFAAYYYLEDCTNLNGKEVTVAGFLYNAYSDSKQLNVLVKSIDRVATVVYEESFAAGIGEFTMNDVKLTGGLEYVWKHDSSYGYMKASAYKGSAQESESWLVSPMINLEGVASASFSFDHTGKFFGEMTEDVTVWAKKEGDTDWTKLTINYMSGQNYEWVNSGDIDLKDFVGAKMQVAFKYVSSTSAAGTWEVKNVKVLAL